MNITFKIMQVNIRRMMRGAEAVQFGVFSDGTLEDVVWMTKRDIEKNIEAFGECEAFTTGLLIYKTGRDVRAETATTEANNEL